MIKYKKSGSTLVEALAALAIISILFFGAYGLIMNSHKASNENQENIVTTTTMQGITTILFNENEKYIKENLLNKDILIQSYGLNGISNIMQNSIASNLGNVYLDNKGDSEKIKYILEISTKKLEKGLYGMKINLITLKTNKQYYVLNNQNILEYGKDNGESFKENIIVRPKS